MSRTDDDNWDLATGVGATATMVAAARAVASRQPDPIIYDPFAEVLVRAAGIDLFSKIVDGQVDFSEIGAGWLPPVIGIRCRAFDDYFRDACRGGIRQAVILASGLDCRPYYLDWSSDMSIFEIDQPAVIGTKKSVLTKLGITAPPRYHSVGIDLRQDWPTALQQAGFDHTKPTAWLAEGLLLGYLPTATQDELLDAISALSAPGSRLTADHFDVRRPNIYAETLQRFHLLWRKHDPKLSLRGLTFSGQRRDPAAYLAERSWTTYNANIFELYSAAGLTQPATSELPPNPDTLQYLSAVHE